MDKKFIITFAAGVALGSGVTLWWSDPQTLDQKSEEPAPLAVIDATQIPPVPARTPSAESEVEDIEDPPEEVAREQVPETNPPTQMEQFERNSASGPQDASLEGDDLEPENPPEDGSEVRRDEEDYSDEPQ